jgi:integrase
MFSPSWPYKTNKDFYHTRDKALCAITYLLAARISEILRLEKSQFLTEKGRVIVQKIELSKTRRKGHPRQDLYRQEAWLPLAGKRAQLTQLFLDYLNICDTETLFPFGRTRAYQIISTITGEPCHWLRAYGENYLYDNWDKDILAVADYIKVDVQTLQRYIRRSYAKYRPA